MGIPSELRDIWANQRKGFMIPSPYEEQKMVRTEKTVSEGVRAGAKTAAVACLLSTAATLSAVRVIPWAKANINYTGQALIVCAATIPSFFIKVDHVILRGARKNAEAENEKLKQRS